MTWRYYLPDEHNNVEPPISEMYVLPGTFTSAYFAAQAAVQDEWDNHDGWERGCDKPFDLVIADPRGKLTTFVGNNEATIYHNAEEKADAQPC
jgi:hypothetical protein